MRHAENHLKASKVGICDVRTQQMTRDECLKKAAQAEELGRWMSYGKDKEMLMLQETAWRERAASISGGNDEGPASDE